MNRTVWIVAALTYLTACGGAPTTDAPEPPIEEPTADAAPPIKVDAGAVSPDAAPVSAPDSAPPSTSPDAAPEAAPTADSTPPKADAAPPAIDAAQAGKDAALRDGTGPLDASDGGRGGYDGGLVILHETADGPWPGEPCITGNVNCSGENMPFILTGTPGIATDVPMLCVKNGSTTAWAFDPGLCTPGYCRQIGDPFYPPGCVLGCRVPYQRQGYTPGSTGALCD